MVANTWFFGTTQKMLTLPLPSTGMGRKRVGYSEDMQYEGGGGDVYRPSNATHFEYDLSWSVREATGIAGLNQYADFASGFYGSPTVFFADPMYYDVNLFAPQFAAPGLAEQGWKSMGGSAIKPTFSNTAANTVNQPYRSATYDTSTLAANTLVADGYATMIIPIPPGMTLWLGASGTATGNAVIRYECWFNGAASPAVSATLGLNSVTSTTRLSANISSTAGNYVKIGIASSLAGAGTITLASMMAQLWPTTASPTLTGNFQSGQGNNGCKFTTDAVAETYVLRDDFGRNVHYEGLAFGLKEVVR